MFKLLILSVILIFAGRMVKPLFMGCAAFYFRGTLHNFYLVWKHGHLEREPFLLMLANV